MADNREARAVPEGRDGSIAGWVRGARARLVDDLIDIAVAARLGGIRPDIPRMLEPDPRARQVGRTARYRDEGGPDKAAEWRAYVRSADSPEGSPYGLQHAFGEGGTPEEVARGAFRAILGREPDGVALALCAGKLESGALTLLQLLEILADSSEAARLNQAVFLLRSGS